MEPAKYCIECGKPLPPESKHCPNCGADVTGLHPAPSDDAQEATPALPTQEPLPQPVSTGSYDGALRSPYGSGPTAPAYSEATAAPDIQRTRGAASAKRLGGGFMAILGGVAMLVAQGFSVSKGSSLNLLNVGLGLLCLVSGVVSLVVRGWGWVILGALLSGGVFALCGLKLYQTVQWISTVAPAEAMAWTLQNGGIIWIGGMILGILAFSKAFQSLFRR